MTPPAVAAMTPPFVATATLALLLAGGPRATPTPTAPRPDEDADRIEEVIRFEEPAPAMRKLDALLGTWTLRETWTRPERLKRGKYEGWPGPGGQGTLTLRRGPGSFSLVGDYDAHNPMGRVTALLVVSWDPRLRAYDYAEIHGAFPGVLHLTGRFEGGDLVFRGEDARAGGRRKVRAVWKEQGQDAWTITWSESEHGRWEPVVTRTLAREGAPSPSPPASPSPSSPPRR